MLRKAKVHVDLLCVVHDVNVKHPTQVYRYFKEIGGQYLQFLPLVEKTGDPNNPVHKRSVPSAAYGKFLNTIFDEWMRHDIGKIFIQLFDESVRPFLGMEHALCIYRETCGDVPVVEHNGDFYSCDHYVLPEYKIGNIHERPLAEMVEDERQREFGQKKWTSLPKYCRECEVLEHVQRRLSRKIASSKRRTAKKVLIIFAPDSKAFSPTASPTFKNSPSWSKPASRSKS